MLGDVRAGQPGAEEGIKAGVRVYLRWVAAHRDAAIVLLSYRCESPALRERNRRFFVKVMGWRRTHVHCGSMRYRQFGLIQAATCG